MKMGFFSKFKKINNTIDYAYTRWGKRFWISFGLIVALYFSYKLWGTIWDPSTGGVTLIIHNELDRPIRGFSVNGVAGANAYANGGGKTTCCGYISGKKAVLIWTVDYTLEQYNAGIRTETHKVTIPLPTRKRGENDLHVHFLPGNKVLLGWSDNAWSPYEKHSTDNNIRNER